MFENYKEFFGLADRAKLHSIECIQYVIFSYLFKQALESRTQENPISYYLTTGDPQNLNLSSASDDKFGLRLKHIRPVLEIKVPVTIMAPVGLAVLVKQNDGVQVFGNWYVPPKREKLRDTQEVRTALWRKLFDLVGPAELSTAVRQLITLEDDKGCRQREELLNMIRNASQTCQENQN